MMFAGYLCHCVKKRYPLYDLVPLNRRATVRDGYQARVRAGTLFRGLRLK